MKYLFGVILTVFALNVLAQQIPIDTFQKHMIMVSENTDVLKKYKVADEEGNPLFYINLGSFGTYHQDEALKNCNGELYLWNPESIFFFNVSYALELLSIDELDNDEIKYAFNYFNGKRKYYIEAKFGNQNTTWELMDVAITKVRIVN